jgi:hypothetical protein
MDHVADDMVNIVFFQLIFIEPKLELFIVVIFGLSDQPELLASVPINNLI